MLGGRLIGGGLAGGLGGAALGAVALAILTAGCGADSPAEPATLIELPDATPGQIVGLVPVGDGDDSTSVEWIDRLDGTVHRISLDDPGAGTETIASIPVGTDGQQRGLLGQVVIDGRRFASWTQPETFELVVGEVLDDGATRLVWSAGEASDGAIGGALAAQEGRIVLGLGRNTAWDRETGDGGAILLLDPDQSTDQQPEVVSVGYTNPWAFAVLDGGEIWVADNAAGPDPDDDTVDDVERIGRADLLADRNEMERTSDADRAPSAMVTLPDGRLGICGFLDNELRAYEIVDGDVEPDSLLERAGTIMPCLTGAAVFDDGTVVTASLSEPGVELTILRP